MLKSSLLYKIINGSGICATSGKRKCAMCSATKVYSIFCVLVPLGYRLLYSWIYNNEVVREVDTAIVDLSHTHTSREFIRDYDAAPDTKATYYCRTVSMRRSNW